MAIEVSGSEIHNLSNPVIITFRKLSANKHKKRKLSCVFWDSSIRGKAFVHLVRLLGSPGTIQRFTIQRYKIHAQIISFSRFNGQTNARKITSIAWQH